MRNLNPGYFVTLILGWFVLTACSAINSSSEGEKKLANDKTKLYSQRILLSSSSLRPLGEELAVWLEKATGKSLSITVGECTSGIVLTDVLPGDLASGELKSMKTASREAFYLFSDGKERLLIYGKTSSALSHGVHHYLEKLGFRWFFPGENWTITPSISDIQILADTAVIPFLVNRRMYGTGGFGHTKVLDKGQQVRKAWEAWERHNGLGYEYQVMGHAGESFNSRQKSLLVAHPEYLAQVNGKRVAWSGLAKHCYSNKALIDLWVKDRIEEYESMLKTRPGNYPELCIGVDPSDGGGHCECDKCQAMGSISDRVFFAANAVAREASRKYPNVWVSLYAYNFHAAVPKIALHPNVYVTIVPYGFQNFARPEEMIKLWSQKVKAMDVLDYWNYTDIARDLPRFNYLTFSERRFKDWKKYHIRGVLAESSYSIGANGLLLYLASKLMWNPDLDVQGCLEDFYSKAFGKAAAPMKRMLERWANTFEVQGKYELPFALRDLEEASRLATTPEENARIDDFKAYVHYLTLHYAYEEEAKGSPQRAQAADKLIQYLWEIDGTYMVHSDRLNDRIIKVFETGNPQIRKKWDPAPNARNDQAWQGIRPITGQQVAQNFAQDKKAWPVLYQQKEYSDNLALLPASRTAANATNSGAEKVSFSMLGPNRIIVLNEQKGYVLNLELKGNRPPDNSLPQVRRYITVFDPKGEIVYKHEVPLDNSWATLNIPLASEGKYEFVFSINAFVLEVKFPTGIAAAFTPKASLKSPPKKMYFFVPQDLDRIAVDLGYKGMKLQLYPPDGKLQELVADETGVKLVELNPDQKGKVWAFNSYYVQYQILNVPEYFFLSEKVFVPSEIIK